MKVIIENPRLASLIVQRDLSTVANADQICRIIEKLLLTKSVIAEKIYLEK